MLAALDPTLKLVRKLTLALTLGMCTVFACYAFLSVLRQAAYFRAEATSHQQTIGRALSSSVSTVWSVYGDQAAMNLVTLMNAREPGLTMRWIDLELPDASTPPTGDAPSLPPEVRASLLAGKDFTSVTPGKGATVGTIKTYVPVRGDDRVVGAIMLEDTLVQERAYLYARVRRMAVAGTLMIVVASLLAMALGMQFVARPIRALVAKARRIGAGDFGGPLPAVQRDELGELAAEMNAMADQLAEAHRRLHDETRERIAALEQLRHAERLSTVGQLASGVAHELGTPLNVISGRAQMIVAGEAAGAEVPASARIIDAQARRMAAIIRQLLNLARRPAPRRATADLHELVEETLTLLQPLAEKRRITFRWCGDLSDGSRADGGAPGGAERDEGAATGEAAGGGADRDACAATGEAAGGGADRDAGAGIDESPARGAASDGAALRGAACRRNGFAAVDADQIRQVVTNLVINAIQASDDGAGIEFAVRRVTAPRPGEQGANEFVCISVADEGHGIGDDVLPHIFEPFFTTKDVGDGTGLGLSVAYGIVEDHAGWIDVTSRPGAGTRFDVYVPTEVNA